MSCSNCYNGCTEITSDKCVRYTGIDVPVLGIKTGDSLSFVEQALIEFLTAAIDGTGILPVINPASLCDLVINNLPNCGNISLNDVIDTLFKSACSLQTQITGINNTLTILNSDYTLPTGCLTGVTASSDTHAIVQAVIVKLCATSTALSALATNVSTNYVRLDELDVLIQEYLDSQAPSNRYYNRMVPYTVVEYYGTLANFNGAGVGIGQWEKIYLCNGQPGTPDKRGRSPIGVIQGVGGGTLDPEVNPSNGNTNYALYNKNGVNNVTLGINQMPNHTHIANVSDPKHSHTAQGGNFNFGYQAGTDAVGRNSQTTSESATGIGVTNSSVGGGQSHNNVHPVLACYYIMYIP